jgi:hypothetical protein
MSCVVAGSSHVALAVTPSHGRNNVDVAIVEKVELERGLVAFFIAV